VALVGTSKDEDKLRKVFHYHIHQRRNTAATEMNSVHTAQGAKVEEGFGHRTCVALAMGRHQVQDKNRGEIFYLRVGL
jgi:hypothetical protein